MIAHVHVPDVGLPAPLFQSRILIGPVFDGIATGIAKRAFEDFE
jgi:hypothetical protein